MMETWKKYHDLKKIRNAKISGEGLDSKWEKTFNFSESFQPLENELITINDWMESVDGSVISLYDLDGLMKDETIKGFTDTQKIVSFEGKQECSTISEGANRIVSAISSAAIGIIEATEKIRINIYNTYSSLGVGVKKYASGGYPTTGQLFLANEAGPELVGSMGGRAAVANNDQIVAGVSEGVYNAVVAAMSQSNGNGGEVSVAVYLDGKQINASIEKVKKEQGVKIGKGGIVYA